jgi:SAM-dependent methyltransferase
MRYDSSTFGDRIADEYDDFIFITSQATEAAVSVLARLAQGGAALELGIGTGRVALPLAARGIAVHGIDASQRMLERLKAKPGGKSIVTTAGDFERIASRERFRLIYVVFNTFFALRTQEAQVNCFRSVAEHLEPQGAFLIEAFVPDLTRFDRGQRLGVHSLDDNRVRLDASVHDMARQVVTAQIVTLEENGTRFYPLRLRYAYPSELDLMAQLAGLRPRERWSGWDGAPFTSQSMSHVSIYERA